MITQGVKITKRCETCGGVLIRDVGQFIDRDQLWWGIEGTCLSCPIAWCEQDSGCKTPEEIRQVLMEEHGPARLRLAEPKVRPVTVLRALREIRGLPLAEAQSMAGQLRATGLTGTLVEMELIASRLRHHSVGASIETDPC